MEIDVGMPEPADDAVSDTTTGVVVKSGRKKTLILVVAGFIAIFVVGGVFAFSKLSGGGVQPEELLPSDTVGFAKIDLNPSFGQKIEFVRFVSHFSGTFKNFDSKDPVGSVLNKVSPTSTLNWDEIKPWIGNRFAIAGVQGSEGVLPVLIIGVSNESQMKYYFAKHPPDFKYVVKGGFLLLADSQGTLDIVAAAPKHLNSNTTYTSDLASLGGSQVAVLWGDLKPLLKTAGNTLELLNSNQGLDSLKKTIEETNVRIIVGLHFSSSSLVATFLTRGEGTTDRTLFNSGETDLGDLPQETLASLSIAGIGDYLSASMEKNRSVQSDLGLAGISTQEIKSILSGPLTVMVLSGVKKDDTPLFAIKLTPKDKLAALSSLRSLLKNETFLGIIPQIVSSGSDIYVGTDAESLQSVLDIVANTASHLRDSAVYRQSIPNPGSLLAYVDLQKLVPLLQLSGDALKFGTLSLVTAEDKSHLGNTKTTITVNLK